MESSEPPDQSERRDEAPELAEHPTRETDPEQEPGEEPRQEAPEEQSPPQKAPPEERE